MWLTETRRAERIRALRQFQNIGYWSNYNIPNQTFNFNNNLDAGFSLIGCQAGKQQTRRAVLTGSTQQAGRRIRLEVVAAYNLTGAWKVRSSLTGLDQSVVYSGGIRVILPASRAQALNYTAGTVAQINESNGALYANTDTRCDLRVDGTTVSIGIKRAVRLVDLCHPRARRVVQHLPRPARGQNHSMPPEYTTN